MTNLETIRNRQLSDHDKAVVDAMAQIEPATIEDQMPPPTVPPPVRPAVDPCLDHDADTFFCERTMNFYEYFLSHQISQSNAATLALSAATLKASVVLGGLLKDLTAVIKHPVITTTTIPVKIPYTGKKRGRKPKAK